MAAVSDITPLDVKGESVRRNWWMTENLFEIFSFINLVVLLYMKVLI